MWSSNLFEACGIPCVTPAENVVSVVCKPMWIIWLAASLSCTSNFGVRQVKKRHVISRDDTINHVFTRLFCDEVALNTPWLSVSMRDKLWSSVTDRVPKACSWIGFEWMQDRLAASICATSQRLLDHIQFFIFKPWASSLIWFLRNYLSGAITLATYKADKYENRKITIRRFRLAFLIWLLWRVGK